MKILIFLFMFFIIAGLLIISNNNLSLIKNENLSKFTDLYVGWIDGIYKNLITITGQTIKLDWMPN